MHHLDDGEFAGEVHVVSTATLGGMDSEAVIAWHHHFALVVVFNFVFSVPSFLFLRECHVV